jgi:hypothetical protein
VIYDIEGTLTHPNIEDGSGDTVTEYVYFYVRLNKLPKTWQFGQIHPDDSRDGY